MERSEIEALLGEQKKYFATGETLPVAARKTALKKLWNALEENEALISDALKQDLGKSPQESYMCETGLAKTEIRHLLRHVSGYARERRVRTPLVQSISRSFVKPVPYGSVLIMSPWNYPVLLSIDPLADALAAGNTVILKPSAYAPATSDVLARLIGECFPPEYVAVVTGGRKENSCLLECRFDHIFFTGSKAVGSEVMRKASEHLTPVTLELGGKSPCIVDETANIPLAARRIVFGKFINCGQTCVAPDYVYCAGSVKEAFLREVKKQIAEQYGDEPLRNPAYGKMINRRHFDRVCGLIDREKTVCGGEVDPESLRIAPTVMDDVTWEDAVMGEEIFGPVLPILTYQDLGQVAEKINSMDSPLALYLFSSDREHIRFVKERIQYGGGCINDVVIHLATSQMGFGGVGASGMGAYHGRQGFDTFSHNKSMVDKKTILDLPVRYQPYTPFYMKLLHFFVR
ncbi:MAG: aldehyde dehydrogenase [Lachnospiraceae bacterium]|nr:aldehyde dehydrogenase [Lachnospiraceae bacterium]MCM1239283.1 aldehyde dehydrogenase [Lachnospiraceae bacterium]